MSGIKAKPVLNLLAKQTVAQGPVQLTWERQGPSYQFKVLFGLVGTDSGSMTATEPTRETTCSVKRLQAASAYLFCVETLSVKGAGPCCDPIVFKTLAGRPTQAPARLRVTETARDTLSVAWDAIDDEGVTGYRLLWDVVGEEQFRSLQVDAGSASATATHLVPGTNYRFQVLAISAAGEGPFCDIVEAETRAAVLGGRRRSSASSYTNPRKSFSVSGADQYVPEPSGNTLAPPQPTAAKPRSSTLLPSNKAWLRDEAASAQPGPEFEAEVDVRSVIFSANIPPKLATTSAIFDQSGYAEAVVYTCKRGSAEYHAKIYRKATRRRDYPDGFGYAAQAKCHKTGASTGFVCNGHGFRSPRDARQAAATKLRAVGGIVL